MADAGHVCAQPLCAMQDTEGLKLDKLKKDVAALTNSIRSSVQMQVRPPPKLCCELMGCSIGQGMFAGAQHATRSMNKHVETMLVRWWLGCAGHGD